MLQDSRRRLTYLMLFRVGVVSFLLVATFMSELAAPADQPTSLQTNTLFGLIAATYGFTIVCALWLRQTQQLKPLAIVQVVVDLLLTTLLVHLTGGIESGFAFMYLLVIVSASFVLARSAILVAASSIGLYAGIIVLRRVGLLPLVGQQVNVQPLREVLRVMAVNAVAFVATGMLGARLAVELERAGERIESTGARLRDLAALHKDVIRCLTSGLITIMRDNTIITYNAAATEIVGVGPDRAVGRPIDEIMPSMRALLGSVPENSPLRRAELHHRGADGVDRILGVSISPLVDSSGQVLGRIVSFQDLTELRRMELAMTRSERLAAVGRLAAGIAHEIRNPLAAISGSIELLQQTPEAADPKEKGDSKELMAIVLREVSRLNELITDLLDFARPRPPDPQRLDLSAALKEMLLVFEHDKQLDGTRVELKAPAPVWVDADANQLRQVVWNLLRNAAEASPAGTPIVLEVAAENGAARVTVRDHGDGIPDEHRSRVFEPFFSTKRGGTGLGLATVHRIVEEHKGTIDIDAPEEGGTEITVRLPLAAGEATSEGREAARR
jgi:two-component system sensor histidine kinase PilS (NtrC family)